MPIKPGLIGIDLAMAVGVLHQENCVGEMKNLSSCGLIGELALDGRLRGCQGVLSMVIAAKKNGFKRVIVPRTNLQEALLVHGIDVLGFDDLAGVIRYLEGRTEYAISGESLPQTAVLNSTLDFSDVRGQDDLIDAIVLAAAGGHNMLMIGEPGCGKTMVAQRIPSILPRMSEAECLEVTKIYSIAGLLENGSALVQNRPFRAPHHNASLNALIGGGANAMPGEVSLAHNGVLFLDELAEFSKRTLDALRQPIEDKKVTISRVNGAHSFPANFIIQKEVHPVNYFDSADSNRKPRGSAQLREIVEKARQIQQERYSDEKSIHCNAQMTASMLQKYCVLDDTSLSLLKNASEEYGYSARTIHKLLRLARTSADIEGRERIQKSDVERVLNLRDLDRSRQP